MSFRIKRSIFIVISALLCLGAASKQDWLQLTSDHFIVYFTQGDDFAQQVLDQAEKDYQSIAVNLGYARYSEFWTWDKRAKIYIYPDQASFLAATGQPSWSEGMADYKNKTIASYAWRQGFLQSLLPHEMTHLIFREFVGFTGEIPLWLDEGVAQWEETEGRQKIKDLAKKYFEEDRLMSVDDIVKLDIRNLKDRPGVFIRPTRTKDNKEGVLFLSSNNLIDTFYLESASLIGYLIERFGSDAFSNFCRELRDGKKVEEALGIAYQSHIHNIRELEDGWREYLREGY